MIHRTSKYVAAALGLAFAVQAEAGTAAVSPALAACSKALVQTLASSGTLPAYTVKAPSPFSASSVYDQNSFTVIATKAKSKTLLAKASCKATPDGTIVSFKSIQLKS